MGKRLELHHILQDIVGDNQVYFQPPENIAITYPCIIYGRDYADTKFADNAPYSHVHSYQVTYIDKNPDSDVPDKIAMLPMCLFSRHYTSANLNHDVYKIYF